MKPMEGTGTPPSLLDRGRRRALIRRGTSDGRVAPIDRAAGAPADCSLCERCGAVYRRKSWRRTKAGELRPSESFSWSVCPACRQVEVGQYFGRVIVRGPRDPRDAEAVIRRIENVGRRANLNQPERRIVSIDRLGDAIEVLTTSQKLAHRMAMALCAAFGGRATYAWSDRDGELLAAWTWGREPAASADRVRKTRPAAARPRLDIHGRSIAVEPVWRDLVREHVDTWAARHPGLASVRVTLTGGRHHRHGGETASIHASLRGRALHVTKRADAVDAALRDALRSCDRELESPRSWTRGAARRAL